MPHKYKSSEQKPSVKEETHRIYRTQSHQENVCASMPTLPPLHTPLYMNVDSEDKQNIQQTPNVYNESHRMKSKTMLQNVDAQLISLDRVLPEKYLNPFRISVIQHDTGKSLEVENVNPEYIKPVRAIWRGDLTRQ